MTQATFGPAVTLDGPLPKKPRYTLLDSANIVVDAQGDGTPDGERWANGAQIWGHWTTGPDGFDPCSTGNDRIKSAGSTKQPLPVFGAFTATKPVHCSSRTFVDWETFERRGMAVFNAVESAIVENQLWEGYPLASNPYLSDGLGTTNIAVLSNAAVSAREGLSMLEYGAAVASQREYVIHATFSMVTTWTALHLIEREGNHLITSGLGTRIVTGGGYPGYGPSGQAPGGGPPTNGNTVEWVYATGPIGVRRGPALFVPGELSQALDQTQNEVTGIFERDYLVYWDTGDGVACPIDRSLSNA